MYSWNGFPVSIPYGVFYRLGNHKNGPKRVAFSRRSVDFARHPVEYEVHSRFGTGLFEVLEGSTPLDF